MDPDQTAPILSLHCLLERLLKHFSRRQKQKNFVVISNLRVKMLAYYHCFMGLQSGRAQNYLPIY